MKSQVSYPSYQRRSLQKISGIKTSVAVSMEALAEWLVSVLAGYLHSPEATVTLIESHPLWVASSINRVKVGSKPTFFTLWRRRRLWGQLIQRWWVLSRIRAERNVWRRKRSSCGTMKWICPISFAGLKQLRGEQNFAKKRVNTIHTQIIYSFP